MAKITYLGRDGTEHVVELANGQSVMEGALEHGVPGIEGKCGGKCICATCHVYIDDPWLARTGERHEREEDLLGFTKNVTSNSRLACQIVVSDALDGLVVRVARA